MNKIISLERPSNWDEIYLQQSAKNILSYYLDNNFFYHTYLFRGSKGVGKTSMARIFAQLILCPKRKQKKKCSDINCVCNNSHNIQEINAAAYKGVNEIKIIKENMSYPPLYGKYKILILDEAHKLTNDALSSLLKFIEEPPLHLIIIFITSEHYGLLETVFDRCFIVDFHSFSPIDIYYHLSKLYSLNHNQELIFYCANRSQGSLRRSKLLMQQLVQFKQDVKLINYETKDNFNFFLNNKNKQDLIEKLEFLLFNHCNLLSFWQSFIFYLLFVKQVNLSCSLEIILKKNLHFSPITQSYFIIEYLLEH